MTDFWLRPDATLKDAAQNIEKTKNTLAVITDTEGRLLGTITDGDIRRALLAGHRFAGHLIATEICKGSLL